MDALADWDSAHRLGYDDFNESLASKAAVRSVLMLLGVSRAQIKGAETNDAFAALAVRAVQNTHSGRDLWPSAILSPPHTVQVWIGNPRSLAPLGGQFAPADLQAGFLRDATVDVAGRSAAGNALPAGMPPTVTTAAWFSAERAAAFWSVQVRGA